MTNHLDKIRGYLLRLLAGRHIVIINARFHPAQRAVVFQDGRKAYIAGTSHLTILASAGESSND